MGVFNPFVTVPGPLIVIIDNVVIKLGCNCASDYYASRYLIPSPTQLFVSASRKEG